VDVQRYAEEDVGYGQANPSPPGRPESPPF